MNVRTASLAVATAALAIGAPLALAGPALASGGPSGGGGHGGGWTCGAPTTQTLPGITTSRTFPVLSAGTVKVKRDSVHDGLIVGRVTAATGWSKSVSLPSGPKIAVQFQRARTKVEFEAAQSAQYYGPDILVTEIKTCTR